MRAPTPAQFRHKAEKMFRAANPDIVPTFVWDFLSPVCADHSGTGTHRKGFATVTATGWSYSVLVTASWSSDGSWMVR